MWLTLINFLFDFSSSLKENETDIRLRLLFINLARKKNLFAHDYSCENSEFDEAMMPRSEVVKIIIFPGFFFLMTKILAQHLKCFMQSQAISTDMWSLSDSIYDEHYAWFHHVVQGMKSIKRNDAEPSKEYDTTDVQYIKIHADIKAQNNSSCSFALSESAQTKRKHKLFS